MRDLVVDALERRPVRVADQHREDRALGDRRDPPCILSFGRGEAGGACGRGRDGHRGAEHRKRGRGVQGDVAPKSTSGAAMFRPPRSLAIPQRELRVGEEDYYGNTSALCAGRRVISVVAHWLPTRTVTRSCLPSVSRIGTFLPRVTNMSAPLRFTRKFPTRRPPAKSCFLSLNR